MEALEAGRGDLVDPPAGAGVLHEIYLGQAHLSEAVQSPGRARASEPEALPLGDELRGVAGDHSIHSGEFLSHVGHFLQYGPLELIYVCGFNSTPSFRCQFG